MNNRFKSLELKTFYTSLFKWRLERSNNRNYLVSLNIIHSSQALIVERVEQHSIRACFRRPRQGYVGGYTLQYWRDRYIVDTAGIAPT